MNSNLISVLRDIVVTGFQIWCLTLLLVNENKKGGKVREWIFCIVLTSAIVIMSYLNLAIPIKHATAIILIIVMGSYIYDCTLSKLLLYGVIFVLVQYCSEIIVIQFWNYFNKPVYSQNIMYEDFVGMLVIMANTICFIFTFTLGKVIKRNKTKIKFKEIYPIIILGIPFLFVLFGLHLSLPLIHESTVRIWFLISSLGVFAAFIFNVMYLQNYLEILEKTKEEERRLDELKLKNEYYLQKLEAEEKVKEIYHDLKNFFILSDQQVIDKQIEKKLSLYERFYETGNDFLNIVLAEKISKAYELGIKIECHVDFSHGDFIAPLDISTIFGNLLDNALEAADKVTDGEKYVFLNVAMRRNLLILVIKNSMRDALVDDFKSDKWNKSFHGYGLKNIRNSLKIYNGEMQISTTEGEFVVNIVIPIPTGEL